MFRRLVFKMKFKEKRGNTFIFDGGYAGEELELTYTGGGWYEFKGLSISKQLVIDLEDLCGVSGYRRIQTAVNLMQILIDEGLV
jgi:hypothetical protein